ncbi:hypothetical protein GCM10023322_74230 [Rugosimonospora acidiphila]|uniref:Uncharacterized protein n=1 Tax=Rugosimonospora acidiphila TaxID=556531 RepID=A0ABP9SMJ7_9ACTN
MVDYSGVAVLRIEEAASIGVLEAAVHLLDLRHALDLPREAPVAALEHTMAVLAAMAPPVDFIQAATGRRAAELFPLLV